MSSSVVAPTGPRPEPRQLVVQDTATLRAIAHPARIQILEGLALRGPMTATACSESTGLSPSGCSYHLRVLAQVGLVEEVPEVEDHRQRPWRAAFTSITLRAPAGGAASSGQARAALAVIRELLAHYDRLTLAYFEQEERQAADWRAAAGLEQNVLDITAAELLDLRQRVHALVQPYSVQGQPGGPVRARRPDARLVTLDLRLIPMAAEADPPANTRD